MTTSMIERMARVLAPTAFGSITSSKLAQGAERARAMSKARALLAAMRDPTDMMVDAGNDMSESYGGRSVSRAIWPAMIDAALEER